MIIITNIEGGVGIGETAKQLQKGAAALDAIEAGVRLVEADPSVRSVGRGGLPNLLGAVQLDAAVMDGNSLRTGAVGAIEGFHHPVSIARAVMERLPHELLVGEGAARFARNIGAEEIDNLTPESQADWQAWFDKTVPLADRANFPDGDLIDICQQSIDPEKAHDTTVFVGLDHTGSVATGVSTSGWAWKYPGRLGDSPVIGAGSYADSRFGAAACTGAGEMTIRAGTSRAIVLYMRMGKTLDQAIDLAVEDLRALKKGKGLLERVSIHAIDAQGAHRVVRVGGEEGDALGFYWVWQQGMTAPEQRPVPHFTL